MLVFQPETQFSYDYVGSLPVRGYRADVTLVRVEDGTRITWHSEFEPKVPLTGSLLSVVLRKVLRDISTRLAVAAEAAGEA